MSDLMAGVDLRTQMVGQNRMELLLFRLGSKQRFGINVFKVKEVVRCPPLTRMPNAHSSTVGIAHMRDQTVGIIDFAKAVGLPENPDPSQGFVILTEYNQSIQGFLVSQMERIVNITWEDISAPPDGAGDDNYLTAVTRVDDDLVEILDVEKVLSEISHTPEIASDSPSLHSITQANGEPFKILVVDDSRVARRQITRGLGSFSLDITEATNGREALDLVTSWVKSEEIDVHDMVQLIISDVEMPEMDGYTFTRNVKEGLGLSDIPLILHTSLSGVFNASMVQKVGADSFLAKYQADVLVNEFLAVLKKFYPDGNY